MRIFFITTKLNFDASGGSIEEFDLMMRTWCEWGEDVTAVTTFSKFNKVVDPLPYSLIEENFTSRSQLGIQYEIFKLLRKYETKADVFHLDGHIFLFGAGLYRCLGGKVPVSAFFNREQASWSPYTSSFFPVKKESVLARAKRQFRFLVEKYIGMPIASRIDLKSFISPMFREQYEDFGLKTDDTTMVIGDPINLDKIRSDNDIREDSYTKRNKRQGPFNIFYSSRMAPAKGFDVLLRGFFQVKDKNNFRLILGGDGPERTYVEKLVSDFHLNPYVTLKGWMKKEELFRLHKEEVDIFIQADWLPYGTSISLLYALAFGLPCILPGGTGLEWVAKDCAVYFKYRDPGDLAKKIEELAADYQQRAILSANCYQRLHDEDMQYEKQIEKLYDGLKKLVL